MNNLLKKLTPPEPLGQCDSNFIGMFQTVRFIQMMSLTFGLFTQVSDSGPLGPLVGSKTMWGGSKGGDGDLSVQNILLKK